AYLFPGFSEASALIHSSPFPFLRETREIRLEGRSSAAVPTGHEEDRGALHMDLMGSVRVTILCLAPSLSPNPLTFLSSCSGEHSEAGGGDRQQQMDQHVASRLKVPETKHSSMGCPANTEKSSL
ncbi:mCG145193, partial [Mus musculus]